MRQAVNADSGLGCVVVNEHNIVLGVLRKKALEQAAADATAREVMDLAPKTFRPNVKLVDLVGSMREKDIKTFSLVTTYAGEFLAAISRADAEATLEHDRDDREQGAHEHKTAESG